MSRTELSALPAHFDAVIIGGGITGAGILREAVRTGAKVLLVERRDFASGTSSWSSKLVHGGLRYLKNGQWKLTLESVRERQRLLREAAGLVEPLQFLMPLYRGRKPGKFTMRMGLWIYDLMAGVKASRWLSSAQLLEYESHLRRPDLLGAVSYVDAGTDDARLVLRLILDAVTAGAAALNYVSAEITTGNGRVSGVRLADAVSGQTREVTADVVINAGGAWADHLPGAPDGSIKLRPLRGSHLVFPSSRFPLRQAVSWLHPRDERPIFAYPWEGAVVYGTTDLDHDAGLDHPAMTSGEVAYLLEGLAFQFPELKLTVSDAIACYSGVRPVVAGGKGDPSAESRESAMWSSPGLVNITGGKLTTFRVTARQVLHEAARQCPALAPVEEQPVFEAAISETHRRLYGRYGAQAAQSLLACAEPDELKPIAHTPYCWAELRWAARNEQVVHLDDLLMRRTRIGLVMANGGREILPRVSEICRTELGWDDARWAVEEVRYATDWKRHHTPPST
ncbi:MAG: glycerol-3-phosphate dehydrogenase/oxidase [Stenotrophobium sp.]